MIEAPPQCALDWRNATPPAFVTSDHDDMLKKRADVRAPTGIVIVSPAEAVQMAHGQAA
jgi:hypothetical protein